MNIGEIKELIKAVSDSKICTLEYHEGNMNISLRKENMSPATVIVTDDNAANSSVAETAAQTAEVSNDRNKIVKSPLVGTIYLSAEEGGEPLVNVGDTVEKGQTLAIVEAMKLMNEIVSEVSGTLKEVVVENGQTVEYDQPLFVIE